MTVCFVELEAFTEEVLRVADEETLEPRMNANQRELEGADFQAAPQRP